MPNDPLHGPKLKIKWADKHIEDIKLALKSFGDANPQRMRSEYDTEMKRLSLVFVDCKPIPPEISIMIGEVLYQFRSALDHLVCQLIDRNGGQPTTRSQFPIFEFLETRPGRQGYKPRGAAMIEGVSPSARTRIEALQPFHRGVAAQSDPLWILHDLNNTDKHRFLIITRAWLGAGIREMKFQPAIDLKAGASVMIKAIMPIEDGRVFAWFETDQREVQFYGQTPVSVAFKEIGATQNEPIIPLLTKLSSYLKSIIASFEPEFI